MKSLAVTVVCLLILSSRCFLGLGQEALHASPEELTTQVNLPASWQVVAEDPSQNPSQPPAPLPSESAQERSHFDRFWGLVNLYENDENSVLQRLSFTGRAQWDYATVDGGADDGSDEYDEWLTRRLRMGFRAQLFGAITIHSEAEFNPGSDPVYRRLTDTYVAWRLSPEFNLKLGKQSVPFTVDGRTSSKELIMLERSNLSNNIWFPQEYMPGVSMSGKRGAWSYLAGVYSAGSGSPEFGEFDAGEFGLFSLGYDFSEAWGVEEALLNVDYVYSGAEEDKPLFTRDLEHAGSVNFFFDTGKWGFRTDLATATGFGSQSDLFGFHVMPFYGLTEKLQLTSAYTHLNSSGDNGVRFSRYESRAVEGRGDNYDEFYAGLNYYFYGHKLKLQTGLKYATMYDAGADGGAYDGWGWTMGWRVSW